MTKCAAGTGIRCVRPGSASFGDGLSALCKPNHIVFTLRWEGYQFSGAVAQTYDS